MRKLLLSLISFLSVFAFLPAQAQDTADCRYYIALGLEGEDRGIHIMAMPEQEIVAEIPYDVIVDFTAMNWSPDAQRMILGNTFGYSILDVESGDMTPLFAEEDGVDYATWLGDEVLFTQYGFAVRTMPAHPQAIAEDFYLSNETIYLVSLAGERLFVQTQNSVVYVEDGETHEIDLNDVEEIFPLSISPDGAWLAYGRSGGQALNIVNVDDPDEEMEFKLDGQLTSAEWSPDMSQVAFTVGAQTYMMDFESGDYEPLYESDVEYSWTSSWTPDGRNILINASYQSIWLVDAATGDATQLSPEGHAANVTVSPCIAADE